VSIVVPVERLGVRIRMVIEEQASEKEFFFRTETSLAVVRGGTRPCLRAGSGARNQVVRSHSFGRKRMGTVHETGCYNYVRVVRNKREARWMDKWRYGNVRRW
jgi:hypothetical protein